VDHVEVTENGLKLKPACVHKFTECLQTLAHLRLVRGGGGVRPNPIAAGEGGVKHAIDGCELSKEIHVINIPQCLAVHTHVRKAHVVLEFQPRDLQLQHFAQPGGPLLSGDDAAFGLALGEVVDKGEAMLRELQEDFLANIAVQRFVQHGIAR
jgi:hypothetical protein